LKGFAVIIATDSDFFLAIKRGLHSLFVAGGVDVNIEGGHYGTAVQAAAAGGHETIVERLISTSQ
jgi:hypothetical protein